MTGNHRFKPSLCDLTSDDLTSIATGHDLMKLRSVCRDVKDKIENTSEVFIQLSKEGLRDATKEFFSNFKGKVSIGSTHGLDPTYGWFEAAMQGGLDLVALRDVRLKNSTIPHFCAVIYNAHPVKIQTMTITYSGSINNFLDSHTQQGHAAQKTEAKFELTFRRPHETLSDAFTKIFDLDSSFDLKTLDLR